MGEILKLGVLVYQSDNTLMVMTTPDTVKIHNQLLFYVQPMCKLANDYTYLKINYDKSTGQRFDTCYMLLVE